MNTFERACQHIPGGVNSPVRAFRGVGGDPVFISHAQGAYIYDENNKEYVDYVGSWGPMILGHAHPDVVAAVEKAVKNGLSFGAPTLIEIEMAELICKLMPSIEMVRMVNSGTEATMSAIRLARGFTNRNKIIKFKGCYHGHNDSLLHCAGIPKSFAEHTLVADFNDLANVEKLFQECPEDIAAIIVEPVAGNMNCILPKEGFLKGLRELCDKYNALLIFDEVMTGFRVALGGAQAKYNIKPDLTTLGKIIGGGMPVGAFGGRRDIMEKIAPLGPVYQAGTLSGNPIAMAAGFSTLTLIQKNGFYDFLEKQTELLLKSLMFLAQKYHVPFHAHHAGSMFGLFFDDEAQFKAFFHGMLREGVYLAPSAFEAGFLSAAHKDTEIQKTLNAAEKVFRQMKA